MPCLIAPDGFALPDESLGTTSLESILHQPLLKFGCIQVAAKELEGALSPRKLGEAFNVVRVDNAGFLVL